MTRQRRAWWDPSVDTDPFLLTPTQPYLWESRLTLPLGHLSAGSSIWHPACRQAARTEDKNKVGGIQSPMPSPQLLSYIIQLRGVLACLQAQWLVLMGRGVGGPRPPSVQVERADRLLAGLGAPCLALLCSVDANGCESSGTTEKLAHLLRVPKNVHASDANSCFVGSPHLPSGSKTS